MEGLRVTVPRAQIGLEMVPKSTRNLENLKIHKVLGSVLERSCLTSKELLALDYKEMATHSSVLAWRIPGMGEPGGLPSMGSHRVRHN